MPEQYIEYGMGLIFILAILSFSISIFIISRSWWVFRKIRHSIVPTSDKVDTQTLVGMLNMGVISFCFITNTANKFNPKENKHNFANVLAYTPILVLSRQLASTSRYRSEYA